ncbi:NAD(P)-dependent oxidoreductase [Caulobacter segnis]|uniref:6-phosphogluconate dehydrogenase NAD-binding protein n=2 Tax=Caulobacter segnis TaxID=88688 RepID=D5VEH2_CAUST|nr:NAD(P)-dependent oxidoreductase [Caulobacter segnis]ADG09115.1 6-phosphogluconate dehydrogenase NAD-binding protein [Caulobacter segnis ATCC 21756]AVQ00936.1 NAD(P)-dependent oxidoreductase [Caulobacter segnis]
MNVSMIGLGAMGAAMVRNLLGKGVTVTVWNRSRAMVDELAAEGAIPAADVDEALKADIVLSMLAHDQAMREVLVDSGALARAPKGVVHVNLATISTALAGELAALHAELGLGYVASPVFGRPPVAQAGGLNVLAAGAPDAVATAMPVLKMLAAKVWPLGEDPVRASALKLAGNFMIVSAIESMGEAVALGEAYGVPAPELLDMLSSTLFAAPIYKIYGGMIAERRYTPPGFAAELGLKDVRLVLDAAEAKGLSMPLADLAEASLEVLLDGEDQGLDLAALAEIARGRVDGR